MEGDYKAPGSKPRQKFIPLVAAPNMVLLYQRTFNTKINKYFWVVIINQREIGRVRQLSTRTWMAYKPNGERATDSVFLSMNRAGEFLLSRCS